MWNYFEARKTNKAGSSTYGSLADWVKEALHVYSDGIQERVCW